jgi:hypothetical protein
MVSMVRELIMIDRRIMGNNYGTTQIRIGMTPNLNDAESENDP